MLIHNIYFCVILSIIYFLKDGYCFGRSCGKLEPLDEGRADLTPFDLPWFVRFGRLENGTWVTYCGGVLVTDRHILTAAHCFKPDGLTKKVPIDYFKVIFKLHDQCSLCKDHIEEIQQIYRHASYNDDVQNGFDVAIVTLKKNMTNTPVCLPSKNVCRTADDSRIVNWSAVFSLDWPEAPANPCRMPLASCKVCRPHEFGGVKCEWSGFYSSMTAGVLQRRSVLAIV